MELISNTFECSCTAIVFYITEIVNKRETAFFCSLGFPWVADFALNMYMMYYIVFHPNMELIKIPMPVSVWVKLSFHAFHE